MQKMDEKFAADVKSIKEKYGYANSETSFIKLC